MSRILFVAGDLSGDQHAARVAHEIKAVSKDVEILAFGGPALRKVADRFLFDLVGMSVVGFWEPIKKLPRFYDLFFNVLKPALAAEKPDIVIPIDFFGFNRFTGQEAKRQGLKVLYFISPQVWASRPGRIEVLRRFVDRMLVIFPFEETLYRQHGVPATFVGHPALDEMPEVSVDAPSRVEPVVGLLPGSRSSEVRRHLPLLLETAKKISAKVAGVRFVLFAAQSLSNEFYDRILAENGAQDGFPFLMEVVRDEDHRWRSGLDFALTSSGTATLENALLGIPMAVVYKMSWITYGLARAIVKVPHISMVNILAGKELVPEFIQHRANSDSLAETTIKILLDPAKRRNLRRELLGLREKLGGTGATRRAAEEILKELPVRAND